jgi:hypothetical protein
MHLPEEGVEPGLFASQASGDTITPTPTVRSASKIIHYKLYTDYVCYQNLTQE